MKYKCQYKTKSVEETKKLGYNWGKFLRTYPKEGLCIALDGDLGAGKTHFSQGIAEGFGVDGEVTSPTFALMNTYEVEGKILYHFDVYRLDLEEELESIGFSEYTEDCLSIVEWASKFKDLLPYETVWCRIEIVEEGYRLFTVETDEIAEKTLYRLGESYVFGN